MLSRTADPLTPMPMRTPSRFSLRLVSLVLCIIALPSFAQEKEKKERKGALRDTLDGAFDLSHFLIDLHGFVPVVTVITEPALGGFGVAVAPLFLTRKKAPPGMRVPPDMTTVGGMYTVNGSKALLAFRSGTIIPWGLRYQLFTGYVNVNMDFYRDLGPLGEKKFGVNMEGVPVYFQAMKRIGRSPVYAGLRYLWMQVNASLRNEEIQNLFPDKDMERVTSMLGAVAEIDMRDNVFTPNKGLRGHIHYQVGAEEIGSDYDLQKLMAFLNAWQPIGAKSVTGFRAQYEQAWGSPAFYQLPYVDMRGIPMMRYQGLKVIDLEIEERLRIWRRWSLVGFVGAGHAFNDADDFGEGAFPISGGLGPRYYLARAFDMHAGLDFAVGPDGFAWYIVLGSAWLR